MRSKARLAVLELLTTEQSYSKSLQIMMETYYRELRNEQFKLKPILTERDIDTIFGNAEDLVVISDDLRGKLEKRVSESADDVAPMVGDIMCGISPFLKLFQKYVCHFESAAQRLVECRDKWPQFAEFLDKKAGSGVMPLDSLLIMPVQRIPRYKLLLEEIIKQKPDDDSDQAELQEALRKVKSQAEECNEATRRRENIMKLREIQSRFKGLELADPARRFIREGKLYRVRSRMEQPAHCTFYLFDDALMYSESVEMAQVGVEFMGSQKLKRKFNIGSASARQINVGKTREGGTLIKLVDRTDDAKYRHAWEILASQKSFVVYAESAQDKAEWLAALQQALEAAHQQSLTLMAAPVARRDVKCCRICGTQFKLHIRKVECSKCAEASCHKCSLEVDSRGYGYQVESMVSMRCKVVRVENKEVLDWMAKRMQQAVAVGEKGDKVRVCHRCLYGQEYNRKNEVSYLSWIKAEGLHESEGFRNFQKQPDKQKVIHDYHEAHACWQSREVNGVEVIPAGAPSMGSMSGVLGELAGQYKKCPNCHKLRQKCQCEGSLRARRVGGFTYGRSDSGLSTGSKVGEGGGEAPACESSSDAETDSNIDTSNYESSQQSQHGVERMCAGAAGAGRGGEEVPEGVLRVVEAWAEFAAEDEVQVALAVGDRVHVLQEANQDGWGYGRHVGRGVEGYFPVTHVRAAPVGHDAEELHLEPRQGPVAQARALAAGDKASSEEDAPSAQMLEPMVPGRHRCAPAGALTNRENSALMASSGGGPDDAATPSKHANGAKLEVYAQAEAKIMAAQRQWEQDCKRLRPVHEGAAAVAPASSRKHFFNWFAGKAPSEAPPPVTNPVPLSDIRHVGAAVELPSAAAAAAQGELLRKLSVSPSSSSSSSSAPPPPPPPPPPPAFAQPLSPPPLAGAPGGASQGQGGLDGGQASATERVREARKMVSERLRGSASSLSPPTPPRAPTETSLHSPASPLAAPFGLQHTSNAFVHPPVVAMAEAPSPPRGDAGDSPGVRALMEAGSVKGHGGGDDAGALVRAMSGEKVKSLLEQNMAALMSGSPGGGGRGDSGTGSPGKVGGPSSSNHKNPPSSSPLWSLGLASKGQPMASMATNRAATPQAAAAAPTAAAATAALMPATAADGGPVIACRLNRAGPGQAPHLSSTTSTPARPKKPPPPPPPKSQQPVKPTLPPPPIPSSQPQLHLQQPARQPAKPNKPPPPPPPPK